MAYSAYKELAAARFTRLVKTGQEFNQIQFNQSHSDSREEDVSEVPKNPEENPVPALAMDMSFVRSLPVDLRENILTLRQDVM